MDENEEVLETTVKVEVRFSAWSSIGYRHSIIIDTELTRQELEEIQEDDPYYLETFVDELAIEELLEDISYSYNIVEDE